MKRIELVEKIRKTMKKGHSSIGSWIQLPDSSVAEIMGKAGYDWVAVDMEHGSISLSQLPNIFRALEIGNTLPLVRLADSQKVYCKQALDAGAGGVILPMIESANQLKNLINACSWPPNGSRGVGFSRANLFGKEFEEYFLEAQKPLVIAMIESFTAVENLDQILKLNDLDAILIGPYDLSASMNITANFKHPKFIETMDKVLAMSKNYNVPCGVHVVDASPEDLQNKIRDGYTFIPYSIDAVFLNKSVTRPI
jgi:2-dehydro-3-deoxyglucarate aldolase